MIEIETMKELLVSTNAQKVLFFLARFPDKSFYEREMARASGISPAGAHRALAQLRKEGLLKRDKKGRMCFYGLNRDHLLAKPLQTYFLVISLEPLIKKLGPLSQTIILFGSSARGDFISESDIDLLIVSPYPDKVEGVIKKYQKEKKIQAVLKTPEQWLSLERKDLVFYQEVNQGITLYEKPVHESNF